VIVLNSLAAKLTLRQSLAITLPASVLLIVKIVVIGYVFKHRRASSISSRRSDSGTRTLAGSAAFLGAFSSLCNSLDNSRDNEYAE
jgi:hypothetical protein